MGIIACLVASVEAAHRKQERLGAIEGSRYPKREIVVCRGNVSASSLAILGNGFFLGRIRGDDWPETIEARPLRELR
jgi:hypothetical protein